MPNAAIGLTHNLGGTGVACTVNILARPDVDADGPPRLLLSGEIPSATAPPSGCAFHPRCWLREQLDRPQECETTVPTIDPTGGAPAACHFADQTTQRFEREVNG